MSDDDFPSITLVTPSYQQGSYIDRTIESVIAQDYRNLDWWIIDAESSDGTGEILGRYRDLPYLTIVCEPDEGQTDAIAKGFERGRGEILGWLNSDDILLPGALRTIGRTMGRNPGIDLLYGGGWKVDERGGRIKHVPGKPFDAKLLRTALSFLQPAMFFRRSAYDRVGGLRRNLNYAMDWDLALRISKAGQVQEIEADLAELRCYEATKSTTGGWERLREIASIGREWNGPMDLNWLSYQLRLLARKNSIARRAVDAVFSPWIRRRRLMVAGWPESSPQP